MFIKVTNARSQIQYYININQIREFFSTHNGAETILIFTGEEKDYTHVKETPELIMRKIDAILSN